MLENGGVASRMRDQSTRALVSLNGPKIVETTPRRPPAGAHFDVRGKNDSTRNSRMIPSFFGIRPFCVAGKSATFPMFSCGFYRFLSPLAVEVNASNPIAIEDDGAIDG